jgi:diadenosine tetraphosphate (Ap4A) HIT family hydrolase
VTENHDCPYCHLDEADPEPAGGWIYRDARWLVSQGPPETTMTGALKITSRRHFTDFAEMTSPEAASFGPLLTRLDTALREATGAERVHLVSTRDRIQHFHAWLYPRPASHPLRGTEFLNAPQHSDPADAERTARTIRRHLGPAGDLRG